MSRRGALSYHDAASSQHGLMVCAACGRSILEGEYRVRDTPDAYITHHRACAAADPKWAQMDREAAVRERRLQSLIAEANEFYRKWGVADLSDYLEPGQ